MDQFMYNKKKNIDYFYMNCLQLSGLKSKKSNIKSNE